MLSPRITTIINYNYNVIVMSTIICIVIMICHFGLFINAHVVITIVIWIDHVQDVMLILMGRVH